MNDIMTMRFSSPATNKRYADETILCVYFYRNGDYKFNVVDMDDLESHIEYNRTFRPGRIMFMEDTDFIPPVEGRIEPKLINDGMLTPEALKPYYDKAREIMTSLKPKLNMRVPTIPYC